MVTLSNQHCSKLARRWQWNRAAVDDRGRDCHHVGAGREPRARVCQVGLSRPRARAPAAILSALSLCRVAFHAMATPPPPARQLRTSSCHLPGAG